MIFRPGIIETVEWALVKTTMTKPKAGTIGGVQVLSSGGEASKAIF